MGTTKRRLRRAEEWQAHLEAHARSGMSMRAYARAHGLNPKSFCNARTRLTSRETCPSAHTATLFKRVVPPAPRGSSPFWLRFPNGVIFEVADAGELHRVMPLIDAVGSTR